MPPPAETRKKQNNNQQINNATPIEILNEALEIAQDAKMLHIAAYKGNKDYFIDFIIIATGTSTRHIDGMADKLMKHLKQKHSLGPMIDKKAKDWIVIDVGFFMAHLMTSEIRDRYDLDDLMKQYQNNPIIEPLKL